MSFFKSLPFLLVLPIAFYSQPAIAQCTDSNLDKWFKQGTNAHHKIEHEKAEALWRKYLQCKPNTPEARYRLGRALREQNRLNEAIVEFKKAIELKPNHSYAYNSLGIIYYRQNKLEKAITAYEKAINIYPQNTEAYGNLGHIYAKLNRWKDAIRVYQKAIDIAPADRYDLIAWARNYKADSLLEMGRISDAITEYRITIGEYEKANQYTPSNRKDLIASNKKLHSYIYYKLGRIYYLQNNFKQATDYYRQSLEINPRNSLAYNGLGIISLNQGKLREAIVNFEQATQIERNFASAQNNLRLAKRELQRQNFQNNISSGGNNGGILSTAAYKSTVRIKSRHDETLGTGWIVKKEGRTVWIVTNRHVVANERLKQLHQKISVEFFDPLREEQNSQTRFTKTKNYNATVEKHTSFDNSDLDLAVLKVKGVPLGIERLKYSQGNIRRETPVKIIGHSVVSRGHWDFAPGTIANYDPDTRKIYIHASLAEGNSGSPVFNEQEQVIGMVVQINNKRDRDFDPNEPSPPYYDEIDSATSGVGIAYKIDRVIDRLRDWNILK